MLLPIWPVARLPQTTLPTDTGAMQHPASTHSQWLGDQRRIRDPEMLPDWQRIARQHAHRQWPAPERPWRVRQTWRHVLFAHWPVEWATLRPFIPPQLDLDLFAGTAWVGLVPFELSRLAVRRAPHRLHLAFPEINVRTYVTAQGQPGVWFFSLDAASLVAVLGARATYQLPYYWAAMQMRAQDGWITFRSQRRGSGDARFTARYQPTGPVFESSPESLERWFTARYCFYTTDRAGNLLRADVNHDPWPLQAAAAEFTANTMVSVLGLALSGSPILHYASRTDVVAWALERVG